MRTKTLKVTIKNETGSLSYTVVKTLKGAESFAKRIANEAFFGQKVEIIIKALD